MGSGLAAIVRWAVTNLTVTAVAEGRDAAMDIHETLIGKGA